MKLVELTSRLQELCHNGYSLREVKIESEYRMSDISEITLILESGEFVNPIKVKLEG